MPKINDALKIDVMINLDDSDKAPPSDNLDMESLLNKYKQLDIACQEVLDKIKRKKTKQNR